MNLKKKKYFRRFWKVSENFRLLSSALQLVSIFFLALYFIDLEKGDLWIVIGLIGSIVLVAIEIFAVNRLGFSKSGGNVVLCVMYLMLFIISYALNSKKNGKFKVRYLGGNNFKKITFETAKRIVDFIVKPAL